METTIGPAAGNKDGRRVLVLGAGPEQRYQNLERHDKLEDEVFIIN